MIFILLHYLLSLFVIVISPLPQSLCPTVCVYRGTTVPRGVVGDRHLVTVPQGVAGDRLPLGGEGQGGGGYDNEPSDQVRATCEACGASLG